MMGGCAPSSSQTLITGVYRSGTEFVSQLVSGHPELSATMYHVNVLRFCRGRYDPIANPSNLRRAVAETGARLYRRYGIRLDEAAVVEHCQKVSQVTYEVLYDALMSVLWLGDGRRHWSEKCQLVWREIPSFIEAMPNGRAILVIRDPRSVLASFKRYTYAPLPAYLGAIFNCFDAMSKALTFQERLPKDRFLVLRYEDAAREPERTSRRLYAFLGLDPDRAVFDPSTWRDNHGELWKANTVFAVNTSGFDPGASIDRWKSNLEDWEIALTEFVCGDAMDAFAYSKSGTTLDWPRTLKAILPDSAITGHLSRYLLKGEGIQAFPTDPLVWENWQENVPGAAAPLWRPS